MIIILLESQAVFNRLSLIKDSTSRNVNMKKINPESSEEEPVKSYCDKELDNEPPDPTGDVTDGQDVTPDNFSDGIGIGIRILKCVTIGSIEYSE